MSDIAVVIPVYNGANMLEDCLRSVQNAGTRISEIIIVDDGSKDDTLSVAMSLAQRDNRINVIHTDNHGTYMARTTGMKAAVSSYVTSIDVDDRYYKGSLDILAELLEKHEADVAMGGLIELQDYSSPVPLISEPNIRVSTPDQFWPRIMKWKTQEFICYINKLYKRELVQSLISAEGICQGEDVLITCQTFLNVKKMVETNSPMYLYYQNPDSLTRIGFGDHDLDVLRVWDEVVEIIKEKKPEILYMARFNRWRTDFTMISRLTLVDDRNLDRKYSDNLKQWRRSLKEHWKDLVFPHAMPISREILVIGFRFFYTPTRLLMRLGRRFTKKETSVILHSGDKR